MSLRLSVDVSLLVLKNKRKWPGLNKVCRVKKVIPDSLSHTHASVCVCSIVYRNKQSGPKHCSPEINQSRTHRDATGH
jgi:hypothetical protein